MADIDNKYPIIFFPVRIETKYLVPPAGAGSPKLRIRFYPDQIAFNSFDPRLTKQEVKDARAYWEQSKNGGQQKDLAWLKLADRYNLPRAAYISKAVINYDPNLEPDPVNPTLKSDSEIPLRDENDNLSAYCDLLPRRFTVYGNFKKPGLQNLRAVGNAVSKSLQLNPLDDADTKEADWVTDFDIAVEEGMAIEVELTDEQYESGFDYLLVFGIRDDLSPEETKQKIEKLFTGHRYSHGLKLVKQGTPTNQVKETSNVEQSFTSPRLHTQSDKLTYRSIEFGKLDEDILGTVATHSPDGRVLSRALGLDKVTNGLVNANNNDQMTAMSMLVALWPSVLSYFMVKFANIQSLDLDKLKNYFIKYISAQGFIPPICVGKTAYGILPVTLLSNWEDTLLLTGTDTIRTFFNHLKKRWINYIDKVPTIMSNNDDISENLLKILSMDAFSQNYNVRGLRSLNYIADFIFEVLGRKNTTGQQLVTGQDLIIKNKLLLNILLKLTFPTIPEGVLSGFYDNSLGSGISEIQYHIVSESEDENDSPPDYIEKIYADIKGPNKDYLKTTKDQATIPTTAPSDNDPLLLRLLKYSASLIGETNNPEEIKEFIESLEILKNINSDRLKTLMFQTLDLVSYRLDAWLTSFANQRLDHLRATTDKGSYIGAFGWIENLMPKKLKVTQEGGYIQAPSYAHAAASAVLRNGYITHSNEPAKKDILKININSERTKEALEIINGIVHTPLPELLGYKLERRLHDANIDYLIDEFRKHFPLQKNDNKKLENEIEPALERVEPRNLTDGLIVFKIWKRLIDSIGASPNVIDIRNFMNHDSLVPGWKAFYSEIKTKYGETDEKINRLIGQLKPELDFLLEQMDGVSDLSLAESVYQAVSGNFPRAGAVLDGMSGDGLIPLPEIATTPRSGYRRTQRVALAFEANILSNLDLANPNDTIQWTNPKKLADPNFNQLLNSYFGNILFWIDIKDSSGNVTATEEISLVEIGFEPIDLVYIEISDLNNKINYYAKSRGFDNYDIRYERKDSTSEQSDKRTLVDVQFMIKALREMIAQGRALDFTDFRNSSQTIKELHMHSIMEIFQRYYNVIFMLLHTIEELQIAMDDVSDLGIKRKREALIRASFFESQLGDLLTSEGNLIELGPEIDSKIGNAMSALKARLPEADAQKQKLLEWKSRLESQGQQAFLESLVDELSGHTENSTRYVKTSEILLNQIKKIFNIDAYLILLPFAIPGSEGLVSSLEINSQISKWMQKVSYVRPRMKLLDEVVTYNQILESSNFSFYCDEAKFNKTAATLTDETEEVNPLSLILAFSTDEEGIQAGKPLTNLTGMTGIVIDDWTDKIVSKEQDTHIAFHFNGPNSEAPQCLLLAVSPNDFHVWDEPSVRKVILETLTLSKLRGIDYGSLKELRHFLPASLLNSYGENIFVDLLGGNS